MPDLGAQLTYDQLPPKVRESFQSVSARLPAGLRAENLHGTLWGWAVSIYDSDDNYKGEVAIMTKPGENAGRPLPGQNDQIDREAEKAS